MKFNRISNRDSSIRFKIVGRVDDNLKKKLEIRNGKLGKVRKILLAFSILLLTFLFWKCEKASLPFYGQGEAVALHKRSVGVREAWLDLDVKVQRPVASVYVYRNDSLLWVRTASRGRMMLFDSTLSPGCSYRYRAEIWEKEQMLGKSTILEITTLDTTSHEFDWKLYEFPSPGGSGVLHDVTIVDENDIWAVGAIYSDTSNIYFPYNVVHWNGQEWELKKIYVDYRGQPTLAMLQGVFSFSRNEIVFSSGLPYLPEGNKWRLYHLWDMGVLGNNDGSVYHIWGKKINEIFFAGLKGTIVKYYNGQWTKLNSGTDFKFQDIWGVVSDQDSTARILAVACNVFHSEGISVVEISDGRVTPVSSQGLGLNGTSVWSWNGLEWYLAGSGLYRSRNLTGPWKKVEGLPAIFQEKVRGTGPNDIFTVGHYGLILHWNGLSWKNEMINQNHLYSSLAVKGNLVVIVGSKASGFVLDSGVILIGKRK